MCRIWSNFQKKNMFCQNNKCKTLWDTCILSIGIWSDCLYLWVSRLYITKAMTDADNYWMDHHLIRLIISLNLATKWQMQTKSHRQKIDVESFKDPSKHGLFQQCLIKKLMNIKTNMENPKDHWKVLKSAIHAEYERTLCFSTRKHQDQYDKSNQEIQDLIDHKCKAICPPSTQSWGSKEMKHKSWENKVYHWLYSLPLNDLLDILGHRHWVTCK